MAFSAVRVAPSRGCLPGVKVAPSHRLADEVEVALPRVENGDWEFPECRCSVLYMKNIGGMFFEVIKDDVFDKEDINLLDCNGVNRCFDAVGTAASRTAASASCGSCRWQTSALPFASQASC